MSPGLVNIAYLVAASLFIFGLKGLSHPRTAVRGNLLGALGMLLAIVITLLDQKIVGYGIILAGIVVGGGIGAVLAVRIQMTAMPQLVALFNGFGGLASILVTGAVLFEVIGLKGAAGAIPMNAQFSISTFASGFIGAITFWGSLVAFGKLQGLTNGGSVRYPGDQIVKVVLTIVILIFGYMLVQYPDSSIPYWLMVIVASVLGILVVIPIGGADMPVVVALLNSFSGLAAAAAGFVLFNSVLIIAGTLVGASGIILTLVMCKAMNRSLVNVLFGTFTVTEGGPSADEVYEGKVKSTSPEEVAMLLEGAKRVCIVPGYGMAAAQAQHAVRELFDLLEGNGTIVEFGVHPVAGRMPGHMNVLLAEADIPYERLKDMDEINPSFKQVDVTIVIGANDVTNPAAKTDTTSAIYGMPILDVEKAATVLFVKRSMGAGYAGVANELFFRDNTMMLFSDAKKMTEGIIKALE